MVTPNEDCVFCGTPRFAVPTLEALLAAGHEIALVVSQPDRPVGRDAAARRAAGQADRAGRGLAVTQPEKIRNNAEFRAQLEAIAPDAIVVVAYGRIIPPWMLALPRLGCINLHASLLPKYRGAAPIQWAVAMGDTFTGNTTMLLEEGLDTGPILLQQSEPSHRADCRGAVRRLADAGAPLVVETLAGLADGSVQPQAAESRGSPPSLRCSTAKTAAWILPRAPHGAQQPLARISALARRIHRARRQKADRPSHGGLCTSSAGAASEPLSQAEFCVEGHRLFVRARPTRGWNSSNCRWKARSASKPRNFCAAARSRAKRGWVEGVAHVSPARRAAFHILLAVERGSAHSDELLRGKEVNALTQPDRNLATALVLGVLRWQIRLDHQIGGLLKRPGAKLDPEARIALRLGAFQLLFLDRIPAHAAIDESVELVIKAGHRFASGMVNAVLRKLSVAQQQQFTATSAKELALAEAHPLWLVERWVEFYGMEAARAICRHGQSQPALALRLESTAAEAELIESGIELAPGELLSAARTVKSGDVTATAAFREGRVRIQDEGSQLIGELAACQQQRTEIREQRSEKTPPRCLRGAGRKDSDSRRAPSWGADRGVRVEP